MKDKGNKVPADAEQILIDLPAWEELVYFRQTNEAFNSIDTI